VTETKIDQEVVAEPDAPSRSDPLADFDRAASRYDLMVALNPGYHAHLRSAARALLESIPAPLEGSPLRLLDLGCGSGASTRALLDAHDDLCGRPVDPVAGTGLPGSTELLATELLSAASFSTAYFSTAPPQSIAPLSIAAVDASAGMLAKAREKDWPAGVRFQHGLAEDLSAHRRAWRLDDPLDGVFAAYLFRNLPAGDHGGDFGRDQVLRTVRDLLRPGGMLVTQEYSVSGSLAARLVWTAVCRMIVMPLSRLTGTDVALYDYLWHSVLRFDSVEEFAARLRRAGFVDVQVRTGPGWQRGILHTFRARVP
jgi:ubiquinone/menaquinone biosynthesis C-methylase UbiE